MISALKAGFLVWDLHLQAEWMVVVALQQERRHGHGENNLQLEPLAWQKSMSGNTFVYKFIFLTIEAAGVVACFNTLCSNSTFFWCLTQCQLDNIDGEVICLH